jgi:hypothetical protein
MRTITTSLNDKVNWTTEYDTITYTTNVPQQTATLLAGAVLWQLNSSGGLVKTTLLTNLIINESTARRDLGSNSLLVEDAANNIPCWVIPLTQEAINWLDRNL